MVARIVEKIQFDNGSTKLLQGLIGNHYDGHVTEPNVGSVCPIP